MSTYQIAQGYNNQAALQDVDPQPASPGLKYPRMIYAVSGLAYFDGVPYTEWVYADVLSESAYASLLSQFGLSTSIGSAKVTVRTMVDPARATWSVYNAIISQNLEAEYKRGFWRNVVFRLRLYEALS